VQSAQECSSSLGPRPIIEEAVASTMERRTAERIAHLLRMSLCELVRSLGGEPVALESVGPRKPQSETLAVVVEIRNEELRGLVGLVAEPRLFTLLSPRPGMDTRRHLADWACEFANRAVGSFRNRMRTYGPLLLAEPPQLSSRDNVQLSADARPMRIPIVVGVDDMVIDAWIDLEGESSMSELPDEELAASMPGEGAVLLF
jgi:hypothetical protein